MIERGKLQHAAGSQIPGNFAAEANLRRPKSSVSFQNVVGKGMFLCIVHVCTMCLSLLWRMMCKFLQISCVILSCT